MITTSKLRATFIAVSCVLCLVLADLVVSGARIALSGYGTVCGARRALHVALKGDLGAVEDELGELVASAAKIDSLSHSPSFRALRATALESDLRTIDALAGLASKAATVGIDLTSKLTPETGDALSAVYQDGRVDLAKVAELGASATALETVLERARYDLEDAGKPTLAPVRRARHAALARIDKSLRRVRSALPLVDSLPWLLGEDEPRRYLMTFLSPSESRGGGGLFGFYGILRADDGALTLGAVEPMRKLLDGVEGRIPAPRWFERHYGRLLGTTDVRNANVSPVFPTTAELTLEMFERATSRKLDGVISLDPVVVGELTRGTGSIKVPGLEGRIGRRTAPELLLKDIYTEFQSRESAQNWYLKRLVEQIYGRLSGGDFKLKGLLVGLGRSAAGGHLKVYARDRTVQDALQRAGLTGDPLTESDTVQIAFTNNLAANKVDYFMHRSIDTRVALTDTGDALVATTITIHNRAPVQAGSSVLVDPGVRRELPSGLNQTTVHLIAPRTAEVKGVVVDGERVDPYAGRDGANPSAFDFVEVPAGQATEVEFPYRIPAALEATEEGARFRMTLWPQATVNPDEFSFGVVPPHGFRLAGPHPGRALADGAFLVEGSLDRTRKLWVELERGEGAGAVVGGGGGGLPSCEGPLATLVEIL